MRTRIIPISGAIMAVAAVLGVGLFVACGPGSSTGSGESGSDPSVLSAANQGTAPIDALEQQSEPADTAEIAPIDEDRDKSAPADTAKITPIDEGREQSEPADTAKSSLINEDQEQSTDPTEQPILSTAAPDPGSGMPAASSREVVMDTSQFRQLLPRDAIAPIYDAQFISAESASLPPEELVIGVEINGESKAYPVGPLNFREMVNDTVGGVPVLVSW